MLVVKIAGGLGNQMFQYAFAMGYLLKGKEVKFDLSYYATDSRHGGYYLDKVFDINIVQAVKRDFFYFFETKKNKDKNTTYVLKRDKYYISEKKEDEFTYHPVLTTLDDAYFEGYWQNASYFKKNEPAVKNCFRFKKLEIKDLENVKIKNHILNCNSVSIHIRRGDYLQSPVHIVLGLDYYRKAIMQIKKQIPNPYFFIFSDDTEWVKENITEENMFLVEGNRNDSCHIDMYLMSLCKHNIIANSTFSWWSAWLNNNPGKLIISPRQWLNYPHQITGLSLKNWTRL